MSKRVFIDLFIFQSKGYARLEFWLPEKTPPELLHSVEVPPERRKETAALLEELLRRVRSYEEFASILRQEFPMAAQGSKLAKKKQAFIKNLFEKRKPRRSKEQW
jgi:hypothetical protein